MRLPILVRRDLVEQIGQHRRITDVAPGDLDGADLEGFLVNPKMDLAPDPPLGPTMLARVPLAFTLDLDAGAVDQEVQRAVRATIRDVHGQRLLATR